MDRRVRTLLLSIENHVGNVEWGLEHACKEAKLDISSAYAARLLKRCTGQGFRVYAKNQRLVMAAEMLGSTDLLVKIIAAELGYRNPSEFTRRFKKQYHLSPREYRKRAA
jgi:AraC-like DNA-binding protein